RLARRATRRARLLRRPARLAHCRAAGRGRRATPRLRLPRLPRRRALDERRAITPLHGRAPGRQHLAAAARGRRASATNPLQGRTDRLFRPRPGRPWACARARFRLPRYSADHELPLTHASGLLRVSFLLSELLKE